MSSRTRAALVRIAIALVVGVAVMWWLRTRNSDSSNPQSGQAQAQPTAAPPPGGERTVPVQVAIAETRDMPIWIEGLGNVAAFQQVTVRSQVDGRLDKVKFIEGQPVKRGDVLAQIDPRPWLVQLHQAQGAFARDKAQLDNAKRNYDRYKSLQEQKLVAQQQVDEYASQIGQFDGAVKVDLASVEAAQLQLDYATVKAPFDGVTGVRLVDEGNLVKASDPGGLVVITAVNPAAIFFTIPQDRLGAVIAAQARGKVDVEIWNRDGSEKLAVGHVAVLDNQINASTATLRLKALADNPDRKLWPNAFVKARMLVETRTGALVIPAVAVQRGPQGTFVYVVGSDKSAQMKPVGVMLQSGDQAIVSGIAAGDQVVVDGQSQIRPGSKVEPVKPGGHKGDGKGEKGDKPERAGSGSGKHKP